MKRDRLIEIKCFVCKNKFVPAPEHAYKFKTRKVCSYTCMRQAERKVENDKRRNQKGNARILSSSI